MSRRTEPVTYVYAVDTFFPIGMDVGVAAGQRFRADDPIVKRFPSQFRRFSPPLLADRAFIPPNLEDR